MASKLNYIIFLLFLGRGLGFQFYTTWGKVEIRPLCGRRRGRFECDPVQITSSSLALEWYVKTGKSEPPSPGVGATPLWPHCQEGSKGSAQ